MKFYKVTNEDASNSELEVEYKASREIGSIRIGETHLFFKRRLKVYYIPYQDIKRCYRRVLMVPAQVCCGKGEIAIENLVICDDNQELCELQLPGTKAAKILVEELKKLMPDTDFSAPKKETKESN